MTGACGVAANGESLSKDLTPAEFTRFRDYIHQHSGIYLEEQKSDSLRISLITRATRFGMGSLGEYFDMLTSDEEEFKELMNLVTINETSFFRFPAQFDALRTAIIPEILESKVSASRQFRVWSAGCSTGEEPYSIAMTLLDSGIEPLGYGLDVLGTDVSTNALLKAKNGVYPARSLLSVPQSVSSRFFEPTPQGHRVVDRVRKIITFQYHNLIKEPYPLALMGNWDVIFCRNVTIYFRLESTRRVVDNFYESLNPGGYLFIGHSETLTSISDRFQPVEVGGVFLYRKPLPRKVYSFTEALEARHKNVPRRTTQDRFADSKEHAPATPHRRSRAGGAGVVPGAPKAGMRASVPTAAGHVDSNEDAAALLDEARVASAEGRTDAVIEVASKILEINPSQPQAFLLLAYAHADSGDMQAATEECHRALAIDPLLAAARYVLGIIFQGEGDSLRAISEFKKTIYIDPAFVLAHFSLANLYRQRGMDDEACREYQNTLRYLYENPEGDWTVFLGGFRPDLLAKTCERSLVECRKGN